MRCSQCDAAVDPGARFCRRCGTALHEPERDVEAAPSDDATSDDAPPPGERPAPGPHAPMSGPDEPAAPAGEPASPAEEPAPPGGAQHAPQDLETSVLATPPAPDDQRRTCPSCGAANSPRRELCGRCGVDLETGVSPPRPSGDEPPAEGPGRAEPERRRLSPWLVVAGLVLVAAAVLGGLTLAGLGPLADVGSAPQATFDSEIYDDQPAPLTLSDVATSSALSPSGGERYDASQLVDDDLTTAWNSDGAQGEDGVGETIDLFLAEPAWVQRVVVDNGFQRDATTYADNARIRRGLLRLDGEEEVSIRLEDLGLQRQAIELPEPVLTTTMHLEITEAFAGDTYPDLAVAGLELHGWTATDGDAEVATERAEVDRAAPRTR